MKQGKVWGTTEVIHQTDAVSVNLLHIVIGGYCSEHRHLDKSNLFHVISGRLEVAQWPEGSRDNEEPDVTVLDAGDSTVVEPKIWHRFHALVDTVCLEIYSGHLVGDDIIRRTQGGRIL